MQIVLWVKIFDLAQASDLWPTYFHLLPLPFHLFPSCFRLFPYSLPGEEVCLSDSGCSRRDTGNAKPARRMRSHPGPTAWSPQEGVLPVMSNIERRRDQIQR